MIIFNIFQQGQIFVSRCREKATRSDRSSDINEERTHLEF